MSRPQSFPIQLKLDVRELHVWLAIVISSNPYQCTFFIVYTLYPLVTMRIDKGEWITADNYGQQKMEFINV